MSRAFLAAVTVVPSESSRRRVFVLHGRCRGLVAAWGGACKDGQLADQEDRTMQNQCGSCDDGFLIETDNFDDTIAPVCSGAHLYYNQSRL